MVISQSLMAWGLTLIKRSSLANIFLISGTLAWFFLIQINISDSYASYTSNPFLKYVDPLLFYIFAGTSGIGVTLLSRKIKNRLFLFFWIFLGESCTALLPVFQDTEIVPFLSSILGLSVGLGLPSSEAFLSDDTKIEERGKIAGLSIFASFGLAILVIFLGEILFGNNLNNTLFLFALVRAVSFGSIFLNEYDWKNKEKSDIESSENQNIKNFILYIIPWLMFVLVGMLAWNLIPLDMIESDAGLIGQISRFICIAFFGLFSGYIADWYGRKYPLFIGLIVLGFGFAILGFFEITGPTLITYLTASGISWGVFFSIYLVIPGDLSRSLSRERFFALIVILPMILLGSVPHYPGLSEITKYTSQFSQILSLILFLALIPIFLVTETLPPDRIHSRRLHKHVKSVKKIINKYKKED